MRKRDFVTGMLAYILQLREEGRFSTAKSYQDALGSFKLFCGTDRIPYAAISKDSLRRYQDYLVKRGCAWNTVSTYMRRIRHIYNRAVEEGEAPYVPHLFKGVFTGVESKRKKAVFEETLRSLMTNPVSNPGMRDTQRAFCLMFLFCGMAFVDLAHLRKADIKDGLLSYHRQKTGALMQVEVLTVALSLLEELAGRTASESPFLLPYLSGKESGEAAYKEYNTALARFNRDLKSLAKVCGVTCPVTSYTIRHSFASALKEQEVPIEMISELLGHKSIKTTQIYLRSFSLEKMSAVNKTCFERIYNHKPKERQR